MEYLDIQAFTYEERHGLLPLLTGALTGCGGWVLERKTLSPTNMEFRVEIQMLAVLDFYAAVLGTGVEFTRAGHIALTELCTRGMHLKLSAELGQIVSMRLDVAFLDDVTLHSLLCGGASLA